MRWSRLAGLIPGIQKGTFLRTFLPKKGIFRAFKGILVHIFGGFGSRKKGTTCNYGTLEVVKIRPGWSSGNSVEIKKT